MATPAQIRKTIDERLDALLPDIREQQESYLAAKGRYFQGIRTPSAKPVDGAEAATDARVKPTDQAETWADAGIRLDAALPMTLVVDVYDGPLGKGFTTTAEVTLKGKTWTRTENEGPETWRTQAWHEVSEPEQVRK